jgi:hypothetical protein
VGVDVNRIAAKAIEAAFENEQPRPKRRHSGLKAVAAGAALAAAARVAVTKGPDMPGLSKLSGSAFSRVPDMVRGRLNEYGLLGEDEPEDEEIADEQLPEDEAPEAEFDDDELDDEEPPDEPDDGGPPDEPEPEAEADFPEDEEEDEEEFGPAAEEEFEPDAAGRTSASTRRT